ncbi:MAG: putative glycoside hydrolase [Oscillospiraceae bacterium]
MKPKQIKIKRYKKSFTNNTQKVRTAGKIGVFVVALAILFVLGFFFAKPLIDAVSGFWYNSIKAQGDKTSASVVAEVTPSPTDSEIAQPTAVPQVEVADFSNPANWRTVNISQVVTAEGAQAVAKSLATEGVKYAIIPLKDANGNVYYKSNLELAQNAISTTVVDATTLAKTFSDNGVIPCAYMSAFKDPLAAYADREMAVKFGADEYLWLDSSADLGGKPWLNPYNEKAKNYVTDMAKEIYSLGFKQIIVDKLQFPSGFGTNLCGYGEGSAQMGHGAALGVTAKALQEIAKNNNASVWVQVPAEALAGVNMMGYDEAPTEIGIENMLVKVTLSRLEDGTVVANGVTADMLSSFATKAKEKGTVSLGINVADSALDQTLAKSFYDGSADFTQKFY